MQTSTQQVHPEDPTVVPKGDVSAVGVEALQLREAPQPSAQVIELEPLLAPAAKPQTAAQPAEGARDNATWRKFHNQGIPEYLARRYWWAYLWNVSVWFFDHAFIINTILFGNYFKLMRAALTRLDPEFDGRVLQITCVYGAFTPSMAEKMPKCELHLLDVADVQIQSTLRKLRVAKGAAAAGVNPARMNAETLAYADNSFDKVVIFFLLHELPHDARARALDEAMRVLRPNGKLLIAEYGELGTTHLMHRNKFLRNTLEAMEPFLGRFRKENLVEKIRDTASRAGMAVTDVFQLPVFGGFYRVVDFSMKPAADAQSRAGKS